MKAKIARQRSQKLQSKLNQRKKKAIQLRNEIEQYLITVNGLATNNQVKRIHVCDAIKVVKDIMDKRSVENYLNDLEENEQLQPVNSNKTIYQLMGNEE